MLGTTLTYEPAMTAKTLFEKVWEPHEVVPETADTPAVLYVDLHLIHEVTSPQAFSLLREQGLKVRRLDRTLATMDHSTPTDPEEIAGRVPIRVASAAAQIKQLEVNTVHLAPSPSVSAQRKSVTYSQRSACYNAARKHFRLTPREAYPRA
jgi:homoaconitase/3-isopropylmalate dehydratase large subunit